MSWRTPRVFAVFLIGGTLISVLMIWLTVPILMRIARPDSIGLADGEWFAVGVIGALVLGLIWMLPAQVFVAIIAALQFSFSKRISWLFVVFVMIPAAALIVTYKDIADCCDRPVLSDIKKLLYWMLVVTPAEVLCAWYVSKMRRPVSHQSMSASERS